MGIEPTLVAWEATVLPLNYAREAAVPPLGMVAGGCLDHVGELLPRVADARPRLALADGQRPAANRGVA